MNTMTAKLERLTRLGILREPVLDPRTETWRTPVPLGYVDGGDVYEYVRCSPVGGVDPIGEQAYLQVPSPPTQSGEERMLDLANTWSGKGWNFAADLLRAFVKNTYPGGDAGGAFQKYAKEIRDNPRYRENAAEYWYNIAREYYRDKGPGVYTLDKVSAPPGAFYIDFTAKQDWGRDWIIPSENTMLRDDLGAALGGAHFGYDNATIEIRCDMNYTVHADMRQTDVYAFPASIFRGLFTNYTIGVRLQREGHKPFSHTETWEDTFSGIVDPLNPGDSGYYGDEDGN